MGTGSLLKYIKYRCFTDLNAESTYLKKIDDTNPDKLELFVAWLGKIRKKLRQSQMTDSMIGGEGILHCIVVSKFCTIFLNITGNGCLELKKIHNIVYWANHQHDCWS